MLYVGLAIHDKRIATPRLLMGATALPQGRGGSWAPKPSTEISPCSIAICRRSSSAT
jgi:hypothetical protein